MSKWGVYYRISVRFPVEVFKASAHICQTCIQGRESWQICEALLALLQQSRGSDREVGSEVAKQDWV